MKTRLIWLASIISLALGGALLYWLFSQYDIGTLLSELKNFGPVAFIGFTTISLMNFGLYVLRWKTIIKNTGDKSKKLSFFRLYTHRLAGYSFSYLTPMAQAGGEPVRMGMLINDGVEPKRAVGSVSIDIALELLFFTLFLTAGFIAALTEGTVALNTSWVAVIFLIIFLSFFAGLWWIVATDKRPLEKLRDRQKKDHPWSKTLDFLADTEGTVMDFFSRGRSITLYVMLLSALVMAFRMVEVAFIMWGFGLTISFAQAFLIATLPGLALLIPIPAGIGVFEGGFATIFSVLAIPLSPLAFVAIIRLRDLVFILLGLIHTVIVSRGGLIKFLKAVYEK